ncbi:MAG: methionyl-tRNA formyltransferase [Ignavibacteria bacterium]|nr:methionyl-tRNA formyltransferase [Ignavibacteria bacterium]
MNIVFMGTAEYAVPSLRILTDSGYEISAVVTAPDKRKGRGLQISPGPVKVFAVERGLKVLQPEDIRSPDFISELKSLKPDLGVVVAFRVLPEEVFSLPRLGSINLHASLLPKYRGAAPINWAIINGEKETGVTTFFIEKRVDTGNIIMQRSCEITPDDDAGSLHDKLALLGAEVLLATVKKISEHGKDINLIKQDESLVSNAPKIFRKDCEINWNLSNEKVYNFIRGLSPHPGAYTYLGNRMIKIFRTSQTDIDSPHETGRFFIKDSKLYVSCADKCLEIKILQAEGRKVMTAAEFISGYSYLL